MKLSWNDWYQLAKKYYEYHGDLLIPQKFKTKNGYEYDLDGYNLGNWISTQRSAYRNINIPKEMRKNTFLPLTSEQVELLLSIDMKFTTRELEWEGWYNLAKKYYEYHGDLLVPRYFKTKNGYEYHEDGYNLGRWMENVRTAYKNIDIPMDARKTKCMNLSKERLELLNKIGIIIYTNEYDWNKMYELAKNYYNHYGDLQINSNFKTKNGYEYDLDGYSLGHWITHQRKKYKNNKLDDEKINQLEEIGIVFDINASDWNKMYELAKNYYKHCGDLLIPSNFKTKNGYEYDLDGYNLGSWIRNQRTAYLNVGKDKSERKTRFRPLTNIQIKLLDEIGMVYKVKELISWEDWYKLAQKYYNHHGNLLVPQKFKTKNGYEYDLDGYNLGCWILNQRTAYLNTGKEKNKMKKGYRPLNFTQIELLEQIGMVFSIKQNKQKLIELCEIFELDYKTYSYLIERNTYKELNAKINFLIDNHYPVLQCEKPDDIFYMSEINMMAEYGISKKELIEKYYKENKQLKI